MRINVICIYWFLLCVSIISSCLLFILVASETEILHSVNDSNLNIENLNTINNSDKVDVDLTETSKNNENIIQNSEIKSSFEEVASETQENIPKNDNFEFAEHLSQNSGVSESFSETNGVIITLVDTATAELKQKAESTLEPTAVEENNQTKTITTESLDLQKNNNKTEDIENQNTNNNNEKPEKLIEDKENNENRSETNDINNSNNETVEIENKLNTNTTENESKEVHDIPSFSEWTQKQLEEEEKKEKVNTSANSQNVVKSTNNLKLRSKNYASPDCGAKIVAANPEAISPGSILSPSRDEYKLNTCTSRIWFIVELCEAIQAKKIDLANFELFSSSPKEFIVSVSDRFPSREWSSVGQFTAKDERDIQSFNLHPHLFGKFIKFEMLSHYGSEHFCPISLFRVYGTSEFEVLETEDQVANVNDDDDDDLLDTYDGEPSNNLFGSARDAVMSIVKKAAEVLVKSSDTNQTEKAELNATKYPPLINSCTTPSRIVVCNNCSEVMFGNVYELLSCKGDYLKKLVDNTLLSHFLYNSDTCYRFGLNFTSRSNDDITSKFDSYVKSFFSDKYTAALCNIIAIIENKVVLNTSNTFLNDTKINETIPVEIVNVKIETKTILETSCPMDTSEVNTCAETTDQKNVITSPVNIETPEILEIKPTKTISTENINQDTQNVNPEPTIQITDNLIEPSENSPQIVLETDKQQQDEASKVLVEKVTTTSVVDDSLENFENDFDKLLSELENQENATIVEDIQSSNTTQNGVDENLNNANVPTTVSPPSSVPQQAQKESVFLRLSSRIKALERNMSLSGQYLEELSRRYKKQVEEMQKAFEKKLGSINDELKKREEREIKLQEQLTDLTESLNSLLSERENFWRSITTILGQFVFLMIFVTCIWKYFGTRGPEETTLTNTQQNLIKKRRKSIDTIHDTPVVKKCRRPSEEALKISGTYESLLIQENEQTGPLSKAEKRRRRKRNALLRTQSIIEHRSSKDSLLVRSSSFDTNTNLVVRKKSAPSQLYVNGDLHLNSPVKIEELPFPLDESEHTSVEPLQTYDENQPPNLTNSKPTVKNGSVKSTILKTSPLFMKTALSSRTKRNSGKFSLFKTDKNGKINNNKLLIDEIDNSSHNRKSPDPSIASNNVSQSSTDDRSSISSASIKKEKKTNSFRKIFKKVFE